MEKLVQHLIDKHRLEKAEALEAIRMVADYLKRKNPGLQHLIDTTIMDSLPGDQSSSEDSRS